MLHHTSSDILFSSLFRSFIPHLWCRKKKSDICGLLEQKRSWLLKELPDTAKTPLHLTNIWLSIVEFLLWPLACISKFIKVVRERWAILPCRTGVQGIHPTKVTICLEFIRSPGICAFFVCVSTTIQKPAAMWKRLNLEDIMTHSATAVNMLKTLDCSKHAAMKDFAHPRSIMWQIPCFKMILSYRAVSKKILFCSGKTKTKN